MTITAEKDQYTCDVCQRKLPFEAFAAGSLDSVSGEWRCGECFSLHNRLTHLLRLARSGKHPGASGAERQAYALVRAVVQHVPGLDGQAQDGLATLIAMMASHPQATRDAVDQAISPRRSIQPVRARIAEVRP